MSSSGERWTLTIRDGEYQLGETAAPQHIVGHVVVVREADLLAVEQERDRLRARTHEIAEAKDAEYREAMREFAKLKQAVDLARERTKDWKADWASPRNPDAPYQWWHHTSHNHAMEAVALVADRLAAEQSLREAREVLELLTAGSVRNVVERGAWGSDLVLRDAINDLKIARAALGRLSNPDREET